MISEKVTLYGYDINIQRLQEKLYRRIPELWGIEQSQYNCYGRVYRNQRENGYVPEILKGGKEYQEVFGSDKVPVHSFFGISGDPRVNATSGATVDVHLIFRVNLRTIKPDVLHRADNEAQRDVYEILRQAGWGFTVKSYAVTGVDRVFQEYQGWDNMKYRDMHPIHFFRFNLELTYNPGDYVAIPVSDIIGE